MGNSRGVFQCHQGSFPQRIGSDPAKSTANFVYLLTKAAHGSEGQAAAGSLQVDLLQLLLQEHHELP
jgi:hypothetical protein